eukprot:jgi/Botrbrau1/5406/Bobra.182_1s0010.1
MMVNCAADPLSQGRLRRASTRTRVECRSLSCQSLSSLRREFQRLRATRHHQFTRGCTDRVSLMIRGSTLTEVPVTSRSSEDTPDTSGRSTAVVVGCGIAGIATARALSPYFEHVVVIERDPAEAYEGSSGGRKGVAQSSQPHALLSGGFNVMKDFFPGFVDDCFAEGAFCYDMFLDISLFDFGKWNIKPPKGSETVPLPTLAISRTLLEAVLLRRLLQDPKVTSRNGLVTGFLWSEDQTAVKGVRLKDGEELWGELVVDASGFGSKTLQWLAEAGVQNLPEPEVVSSGIVYVSCRVKRPADWPQDRIAFGAGDRDGNATGSLLLPVENSEWMLICSGSGEFEPPQDKAGLLDWTARYLPVPDMHDVLSKTELLSEPRAFRRTDNINRHFEQVAMPDGLAVLGDAVCTFNPSHGQGMTVATKGAALLGSLVASRLPTGEGSSSARLQALQGLPKEFQAKLAEENKFPWTIATAYDVKTAIAQGKAPAVVQTPVEKLLDLYMDLVFVASKKNWRVVNRVNDVLHLVKPPTAMFHPTIVAGVLVVLMERLLAAIPGAGLMKTLFSEPQANSDTIPSPENA